MSGTEVTARDVDGVTPPTTRTVRDSYVIVTDGRAAVTNVQRYLRRDGSWTHVLTIKAPAPTAPDGEG